MLRIRFSNRRERRQFDHPGGPLEIGRGPGTNAFPRCIIQDLAVSRNHVRVEEVSAGVVGVENLSERAPIRLADGSVIAPRASRSAPLPLRLMVGETLVLIEAPSLDGSRELESLARPAPPPNRAEATVRLEALGEAPTAERLTCWFETVLAVQRAAAGSPEFYEQTARALVDLVGLDGGFVLLRLGEGWQVAASASARPGGDDGGFSSSILRRVVAERRTFYQAQADAALGPAQSLTGVQAVVAAPVFGAGDHVVAVLYGSRRRPIRPGGGGIGKLEAQVVQMLASAAGAGLARLEQEADAARLRVQLEQFVSPALAAELERDPRLLEGRQREVTVLFSDLRNFSSLAERTAATAATDVCRLVAEAMECLTEHVRATEGVVVDYHGDGLCAMWNAPFDQPDHAARAGRTALALLAELPRLSARWQECLGQPLVVGLGINSGVALVGNTGSRQKLKYGPFGHTVNLASRTEGATKHLGVLAVLTGATRALLGDEFAVRRLCRARLAGMREPVELYELHAGEAGGEWAHDRDVYEEALRLYEAGEWAAACRTVSPLLGAREGLPDVPALNLLSRAVECAKPGAPKLDPVWEFATK
jgi:adenylate cyclase